MNSFNPFNPNSVVVPSLFAGRATQVLEICRKLSRIKHGMPSSFFIFGERGIGKTALAKLILHVSKSRDEKLYNLNLLTAYYCVEKGQEVGSVLQESINSLTSNIERSLIENIGLTLGKLFENGKIKIGVFDIGVELEKEKTAQRAVNIKDQAVFILSSIMKSIRAGDQPVFDGALIVIDEMHNLNGVAETASILRNIVTSLDVMGLGHISFLLIGYEEDAEKFFSIDSSSHRTFDSIKLEVMPEKEAKEILVKGFTEAGVTYDEDALTSNIGLAGGYPHSIQMIGHHLIETDEDQKIDKSDWNDAVVKTAVELRTKDFSKMYSFGKALTKKDNIILKLADSESPLSKKELARQLNDKNIYQYLGPLKKSSAIKEDESGKITLQSQLFRTAVLFDQYIRAKSTPAQAASIQN